MSFRLYIAVLGSFFIASSLAHAADPLKEQLEEDRSFELIDTAKVKEKLRKEIAQLHVKTRAKLFDLDQIDGLGLGAKYRYEAEPSYQNSFYTRTDEWVLNVNVNPGDFIDSLDLTPVYLRMNQDTVVSFSRQFPSQGEALKALPYGLSHLPFNADRAREKLEPGDFVSFHANLNVAVGASFAKVYGLAVVSDDTHIVISGDFEIRVYRRANDEIRLQLIATQGRGIGVGVSVGPAEALKVTGVKIVDRQILRRVHLDPFSFSADKKKSSLFMIDYVLDLKDKEVRDAYNDVIRSSFRFKNLEVLGPLKSVGDITDTLVSNIVGIEEIFQKDKCLSAEKRRVRRIKKGRLVSDQDTAGVKVGLNIVRIEGSTTYTRSMITLVNGADESPENFILDSWQRNDSAAFIPLFGVSESRKVRSMNALYKADVDFNPTEFTDLGVFYDRKENPFNSSEQFSLLEHMKYLLPSQIYQRVDQNLGEWKVQERRNAAHLIHQVFFHRGSLKTREGMPEQEIRDRFIAFVDRIPHLNAQPQTQLYSGQGSNDIHWSLRFKLDIDTVVKALYRVFQVGLTPRERVENVLTVTNVPLFQEVGVGFLISVLPQEKLEDLIRFSMLWRANETPDLKYHWPETADAVMGQHSKLYGTIMSMQSKLFDRGIDLRKDDFDDESNSCTTSK